MPALSAARGQRCSRVGSREGRDMTMTEMPLPDIIATMMTGTGPVGAMAIGRMFSVVKLRLAQQRGEYGDPGWFGHSAGSVASE